MRIKQKRLVVGLPYCGACSPTSNGNTPVRMREIQMACENEKINNLKKRVAFLSRRKKLPRLGKHLRDELHS